MACSLADWGLNIASPITEYEVCSFFSAGLGFCFSREGDCWAGFYIYFLLFFVCVGGGRPLAT